MVDDEPGVRRFVCTALQSRGYKTLEASTGEGAISLFMEKRPDLVVLDVLMPGLMDGIEVAKELHKDYITPIIFLSSKKDKSDRKRGYEAGAVEYLSKPIDDPDELVKKIRALLKLGRNVVVDEKPVKLHSGNLRADRVRQQVYWHDVKVQLSQIQFKIVLILLEQPDELIKWKPLKQLIYGHEYKNLSTVKRHVYDVKGRFKDTGKGDPIEVVHGGVRLVESS